MKVVGRRWWKCVHTNEFLLLLPVLTWWTIRLSFEQRVVDVLRTLPTVYLSLIISGVLEPWTLLTAIVFVYTVICNMCMYHLDKKSEAKYVFSTAGQALVMLTLISPSAFLTGSPSFWTGVGTSWVRYICLATNLLAGSYLAISLLVTKPYSDAWFCYPHPRDLVDLKWGYCPQAFNDDIPLSSTACYYIDDLRDNARCDPDLTEERRSLHEEASGMTHLAMELLGISLLCYLLQVPRVLEEMRSGRCSKQD